MMREEPTIRAMSLEGMVFVITGGSSGIGAATAAVAAESGAKVVIGSRSVDRGNEVVREIAAGGGQAIFQRCDVGVEQDVRTLMEAAADTYGGIDVLVCNAGVTDRALTGESDLEHMDVGDFRRVLDVNLVGAWLCAKYALPYLKESDNASIVMAGSSASFLGFNGLPAYVSAKAGLSVLTKELAVELSRYGIRVNCYCPHTIRTPMVEGLFAKAPDPEAAMAKHVKTALVRRFGTPREVGQLICFLAGREAAYINGVSIPIDGGTLAWRGTVDQLG
jgi:NAD(P)-dependent dehydrogenase (short-subunit alcohol dehydrogenase family)